MIDNEQQTKYWVSKIGQRWSHRKCVLLQIHPNMQIHHISKTLVKLVLKPASVLCQCQTHLVRVMATAMATFHGNLGTRFLMAATRKKPKSPEVKVKPTETVLQILQSKLSFFILHPTSVMKFAGHLNTYPLIIEHIKKWSFRVTYFLK